MNTANFRFPIVTIEGPPRERGRQYGSQLTERIEKSLRLYMPALTAGDTDTREGLYARARGFVAAIDARFPEILQEVVGIAEGAERDVEEIVALNARTELLFAAMASGDDGCTGALILSQAAGDRVLMGQNWDWKPECRDTAIILRVLPDRGPSFIGFVEAGLLGRNGLNSAGLGLCGNFLGCNEPPTDHGIPIAVVRRAILQSETLPEAVGHVLRSPRAFATNHLIGHRDSEGIDLEATPRQVFTMFPEDGLLVHSNHFVAGADRVRDTGLELFPDSLFRDRRVRSALAAKPKPLGVEDLQEAFRDHFGYPDSVCRHRPDGTNDGQRGARANEIETVASLVMDLGEGRLWVSEGPPCTSEYRPFSVYGGAEEAASTDATTAESVSAPLVSAAD
jgi:isopenicillin-N N-acyltransferase-like protein